MGVTAHAQDRSLQDLLSRATTDHPTVAGRRAERDGAEAEREAAGWQRFPTVTAEVGSTDVGGVSRTLRLDQPLWTAGRIEAGMASAGLKAQAAQWAVGEAQQDVRLRVLAAASEALRQQDRLLVAKSQVAEMDRLLDMIRRRVAQEVSARADLNLALSRRLTSLGERAATEQALAASLVQLSQLSGVTVGGVNPVNLPLAGEGLSTDIAVLTAQALDRAPRLQRLRMEAQAAEASIRSRRAALFPQVVFRLQTQQGDGVSAGNRSKALLLLQASPGAGLSAASGVAAAEANWRAAVQAHDAAERELVAQVAQDRNEWLAAQARASLAAEVQGSAADVAASYGRQYAAGRKSWIDVLNAVREAGQAELGRVDASHQAQAAAWRLRLLTGAMP